MAEGRRGHIPETAPPILRRLGLDPEGFLGHVQGRRKVPLPVVLGHVERIRRAAGNAGVRFLKGVTDARRLYLSTA